MIPSKSYGNWMKVKHRLSCGGKLLSLASMEASDNRRGGVLWLGNLRYTAYRNYAETTHDVQFLPGRCLRLREEVSSADAGNENPPLSWRTWLPSHSALCNSDDESCNEGDWNWNFSDEVPIGTVIARKRTADQLPPLPHVLFQVKKMRECHSRILMNFLSLRRQVIANMDNLQGKEFESDEHIVERVMYFLWTRVSIRLQKPVRASKSIDTQQAEGVGDATDRCSASSINVKTDCEFNEFEAIARFIQQKFRLCETPEAVVFYPSFGMTQNPCLGGDVFYILFPSLRTICEALGISSVSDRVEMAQRYGSHGNTTLLRLLGTLFCPGSNSNTEEGCSMVLGRSCVTQLDNPTDEKPGVQVLKRDTMAWNMPDRRYQSSLYSAKGVPRNDTDPRQIPDICKKAFMLRWRRDLDPNSRMWSKEICRSTRVTGFLEVVFPCMLVPGNTLVDEVEKLVDENMLKQACE